MNTSRIARVSLVAGAIGIGSFASLPSAQALPFKQDCLSMAQYAAAIATQQGTNGIRYSFKGFSGPISKKEGFSDFICDGGFIFESSPRGTLVCNGYIHYDEEDKAIRWASGSFGDLINEIEAGRRRIAAQEQDFQLETERQRRRAAGQSTDGIDLQQRLNEATRCVVPPGCSADKEV